jgi:preprotein translocase subunit SecF
MQFFGETRIDFMSARRLMLSVSALVILAAAFVLYSQGIKQGVEFSGGAHVILRYVDPPQLSDVRAQLIDAGISGGSVTAFGDTGGQEIVVRVPLPGEEREEREHRDLALEIVNALRPESVRERAQAGELDLNIADQVTVAHALRQEAGFEPEKAERAATVISEARKQRNGLFGSIDEVASLEGLPEGTGTFLREHTFVGPFALRGQEFIEASISQEMQRKAFGAIAGALVGMLIYIWIRFQLVWGFAAIMALIHDTAITLGAFALAGMEANLPVVAAFLTLVGYSINDTIVVFDRIRENLKMRGTGKLEEVINLSINQNLSRTLITSLTTLIAVSSLFLFGGPVIRPFSFVLLIGVVVGTYSSMYIASPALLFFHNVFAKRGEARAAKAKMPRAAKKVQS